MEYWMKKIALVLFIALSSISIDAAIALSDQSLDSIDLTNIDIRASRSLSGFAAAEMNYDFVEINENENVEEYKIEAKHDIGAN